MKIKKIFAVSLLSVAAFSAPAISATTPQAEPEYKIISTCNFPLGKYKYLFSDGAQTYYFSPTHTIYVNPDGTQIVKKGDFRLKGKVSTYERVGNKFIYTNPAGTYMSENGGTIYYTPSAVAAQIAAYTNQFTDAFGHYKKQDGKIIFTPKRQLQDLEVTKDNCGLINIS